jgi:hypothetical protein
MDKALAETEPTAAPLDDLSMLHSRMSSYSKDKALIEPGPTEVTLDGHFEQHKHMSLLPTDNAAQGIEGTAALTDAHSRLPNCTHHES